MNLAQLSKATSYALRHEPWLYELDDEGWVPVGELLSALRNEKPEWSALSESDLAEMIIGSEKKRHELHDGKIRALYDHSVPGKLASWQAGKLAKQAAEPPAVLYHGTSPEIAKQIKADGLRPMSRQYVHLSVDQATAEQVGKRKAKVPTLLIINAAQAHAAGVAFYRGNDLVWLTDFIPPSFIG